MNHVRSIGLLVFILLSVAAMPVSENTILRGGEAMAAQSCPTIKVTGPYEVKAGEPITFTTNVTGGPQNIEPTFNWSVSAGAISSGQGTSTIIVDTKEVSDGGTVTASVELGGYDRTCNVVQSITASILAKKPESRKVAEYGKVKIEEEKSMLDSYAIELGNDPTAQGFIITYPARAASPAQTQATVKRALSHIIETRHIDKSRIINIEGAAREKLTIELWVVPAGGDMPQVQESVEAKPIKEKPKQSSKPQSKSKKA